MIVKGKIKFKTEPNTIPFRLDRKLFVEWIDEADSMINVDWLIVDVCLTRWYYDHASGWYSAPRIRYVPNEPDKWKLTYGEMFVRMKPSPRGFTQR